MKKIIKEFRDFAVKGNVIDLAIGIIIGGAFGKIVTSVVGDVVMPLLGAVTGKINLSGLKYVIMPKSGATEELAIRYGNLLQSVVDFVIIAASVFLFVKLLNSLKTKQEEAESAAPPKQEILLEEIRDILKEKSEK